MGDDTGAVAATAALATDDGTQKDEDADSVDSLTF